MNQQVTGIYIPQNDEKKKKLICPLLGAERECIMMEQFKEKKSPPMKKCIFFHFDQMKWGKKIDYKNEWEEFILGNNNKKIPGNCKLVKVINDFYLKENK